MQIQVTNRNEAGKLKSKVWPTNIPIIAEINKSKNNRNPRVQKNTNANSLFFVGYFPS